MSLQAQLVKLFTTEQFTKEIVKACTNTMIDKYLSIGCRILVDAEEILESGEYEEHGINEARVKLDIERIKYNLDRFQEALMIKEKAEVITKYGNPMFFHAN